MEVFFDYVIVSVHLPDVQPFNFGVLLVDRARGELYYRFQTELPEDVDGHDAAAITGFPEWCASIANERGAEFLLRFLLDSASNVIRISDIQSIAGQYAPQALSLAYSAHVVAVRRAN